MSFLVCLFCYTFFAGIALSMAAPPLRPFWPWAVAAAVPCAAGAAWAHARMRRAEEDVTLLRQPALPHAFRALLCACALASGFARHAATFQDGARRIGALAPDAADGARLARAAAALSGAPAAPHAVRRRPGTGGGDVSVWVTGDQRLLRPILDDDGTPQLDARGRWRFRETVRHGVTCRVALPAGAAEARLPEPFSAVRAWGYDGAPGPDAPALELVRLASTVDAFSEPRPANAADAAVATVLGRIADDPELHNAAEGDGASRPRTVLNVEPWFVQPRPGAPFYPVAGGHVQVTVNAADGAGAAAAEFNEAFAAVSRTEAFGNDVVVRGALEEPAAARNPGGFDYRRFLLSHGLHAQMSLHAWQRMHGLPLAVVAPAGAALPRSGNPVVAFSLRLRDRMLRTVKRTLPYPASAFAGGITLGMRHGMDTTRCAFGEAAGCLDSVPEEFKRAGVNHVLAVSGLHVTIIGVMLIGLFSLLRLGRRAYVPLVLAALVVFAIITGARPSTLRAVIMNGLFLVVWAYLGTSLRTSVLVAAAVAGWLIMMQNPRLLVDPSFTLSFGAVLSLGLLTGPCTRALSRFRGNDLLSLAVCVAGFHAALLGGWWRVAAPRAALAAMAAAAAVFALGRWLARRGVRPIGDYGFADLPMSVGGFLAAQGAIQLGMMVPLSAYYFSRWPVIGSAANLVAIPLVGVVLQLSMLACLVGLVPWAGPVVALVLNAANWLGCLLFMGVAHVASSAFPYPFVRRPAGWAVGVYYAALALFAFWPGIPARLRPGAPREPGPAGAAWRAARRLAWAAVAAVCALAWPKAPRGDGSTRVSVLSVGYGSSVLVRAPDGRAALVDAGHVRRDGARASQAERTILPRLSALGIRRLDTLAVLSARPERLAGAALVCEQCLVDRLALPPALAAAFDPATHEIRPAALDAALPPDSDDPAVAEARGIVLGAPDGARRAANPSLASVLRARRPSLLNRLLGTAIRIESTAAYGTGGRAPFPALAFPRPDVARVGTAGGAAMLLPGDCPDAAALAALVEDDPSVRALSAPCHGALAHPADAEPLWRALAGRGGIAVFEYGPPRPVLGPRSTATRDIRASLALAGEILGADHVRSTDRDGAVELALR